MSVDVSDTRDSCETVACRLAGRFCHVLDASRARDVRANDTAHTQPVSQVSGVVSLQPSVRAMRVPVSAAGTPRDVHIVRHRGSFTASVRRKRSKHATSLSGAM